MTAERQAGDQSSARRTLPAGTSTTPGAVAPERGAYGSPDGSHARLNAGAPPTPGQTSLVPQRLPARSEVDVPMRFAARRKEPAAVLIRGAAKAPHPATRIVPRRSGPRSAVAQFTGGMVLMLALLASVALATPLGQTATFTGAFQTYANAVRWIPTPTPTPKPTVATTYGPPHEANPGTQAIVNEIVAVFGPYAQGALAVARCESGYDPNAWNPYPIGNSHASGVFQILYPSTWDGTSYASYSPFNANANIHAAYQLFSRDGHTWREWQCQP